MEFEISLISFSVRHRRLAPGRRLSIEDVSFVSCTGKILRYKRRSPSLHQQSRRPDRPIDQSFGRTFGSCLKHCRIPRAGHCPIQTDENQSPLVEQIVLFLDPRSKKFGAHISIGDSLKHIPSSQGRNGVRLDKHPRIHASGDKDLKVPGYLEHSES